MISTNLSRRGLCLAAAMAVAVAACGGDRDAPKIPLDRRTNASVGSNAAETRVGISGEAKIALDSGNTLFRAKAYDRALAQYRRSAQLAPTELAPLFGILMVTDVTKDVKLADSTRSLMRELNPALTDSSVAVSHAEIVGVHSRSLKAAPTPRGRKGPSGATLPPVTL